MFGPEKITYNKTITPKDVLEASAKYGHENVLAWGTKKPVNKKGNNYVNIYFKHADGDICAFELSVDKIVLGSRAKATTGDVTAVKNLVVNIAKGSENDIQSICMKCRPANVAPNKQEAENKRATELTKLCHFNTCRLNQALDVIDASLRNVSKEIKEQYLKSKSSIEKCSSVKVIVNKDDGDVEEYYSVRISLNPETREVCCDSWNGKERSLKEFIKVYDKKNISFARALYDGELKPLRDTTAPEFIVRGTLIVKGVINFKQICFYDSNKNVTLLHEFKEMLIINNVSSQAEEDKKKEAQLIKEMESFLGDDESDLDEPTQAPILRREPVITDNDMINDLSSIDGDFSDAEE